MDVAKFLAERLCEIAGGAVGKCDPDHCVCGAEGRQLAKAIEDSGYQLIKVTKTMRRPFDLEETQ